MRKPVFFVMFGLATVLSLISCGPTSHPAEVPAHSAVAKAPDAEVTWVRGNETRYPITTAPGEFVFEEPLPATQDTFFKFAAFQGEKIIAMDAIHTVQDGRGIEASIDAENDHIQARWKIPVGNFLIAQHLDRNDDLTHRITFHIQTESGRSGKLVIEFSVTGDGPSLTMVSSVTSNPNGFDRSAIDRNVAFFRTLTLRNETTVPITLWSQPTFPVRLRQRLYTEYYVVTGPATPPTVAKKNYVNEIDLTVESELVGGDGNVRPPTLKDGVPPSWTVAKGEQVILRWRAIAEAKCDLPPPYIQTVTWSHPVENCAEILGPKTCVTTQPIQSISGRIEVILQDSHVVGFPSLRSQATWAGRSLSKTQLKSLATDGFKAPIATENIFAPNESLSCKGVY